jgi:hypothetical protein
MITRNVLGFDAVCLLQQVMSVVLCFGMIVGWGGKPFAKRYEQLYVLVVSKYHFVYEGGLWIDGRWCWFWE